jgi:hypothetical protein
MHSKKRFLVATFGAVVALAVQTPVSAYITKARAAAGGHSFGRSQPPSYLTEAFKDASQRVLNADRWAGWRSATPDTLADDRAAPDARPARIASTLGDLDLHRLVAGATGGHNGGSGDASSDRDERANASSVGGHGREGSGAGGAGGIGGSGGGGGGYASGHGNNGEGGGAGQGWHAGSFEATDDHHGEQVFVSGSGGLLNHNWGSGNSDSGLHDSHDSDFCDEDHGGGVGSSAVPEPTTLLFLAGGLAGLAARARRGSAQGQSAAD